MATQSDTVLAGYAQHVEINDVPFKQVGCNFEIRKGTFKNTDDGDGPFQKDLMDSLQFFATVNFQSGTEGNPHAAPYFIMDFTVDRIKLKVFHRGWAYEPYHCPSFTITSYSGNGNPQQGPVGGAFSGQSYGRFYLPTDAASSLAPGEGEDDPEPFGDGKIEFFQGI